MNTINTDVATPTPGATAVAGSTNVNPTAMGTDLISRLKREKDSARKFQDRRHEDWNENYELYRNKVKLNRLTQRQAVSLPLMKETIKTLLSKVDDPPLVIWKEKSGDQQKELIYQEIWNDHYDRHNLEILDILDKKNVLTYGISTKKLNLDKKGVSISALDVFDVLYDPLTNPLDIETARYIVHQNIFKPLKEILVDKKYSEEGKNALRIWATTEAGMVQAHTNKEEYEKKMERLKSMGVTEEDVNRLPGGDVIVNLSEHFTNVWDTKTKSFVRTVVVYADNQHLLMEKTLKEAIGVEFWPMTFWFEDIESNDIYPDAVADLVRTPNKILNVWFSQLVENRTLRNFQMHWYDATAEGYTPQTYEPGPGRMLPAPGDPNKTIMPVEISGLDETLTAIQYLTTIIERGSGATAIEKGQGEKKTATLGEIQVLVGKATERALSMSKFYRRNWYETCMKWNLLMQANAPAIMKLYKTGTNGKLYEKVVYKSDWVSEAGYKSVVASSSEQEEEQTKGLQKLMFLRQQFPGNPALEKIIRNRALQMVDLTPEEVRQVDSAAEKMMSGAEGMGAPAQPGSTPKSMGNTPPVGAMTPTAGMGQMPSIIPNAPGGNVAGASALATQ